MPAVEGEGCKSGVSLPRPGQAEGGKMSRFMALSIRFVLMGLVGEVTPRQWPALGSCGVAGCRGARGVARGVRPAPEFVDEGPRPRCAMARSSRPPP